LGDSDHLETDPSKECSTGRTRNDADVMSAFPEAFPTTETMTPAKLLSHRGVPDSPWAEVNTTRGRNGIRHGQAHTSEGRTGARRGLSTVQGRTNIGHKDTPPPLFGVMVLGTPTVSRDLAMRKRTVLKGRVILAGHSTVCGCAHPDAVCKMVPYR